MDFGIRRLQVAGMEAGAPYHLYDRDGRLILVADTGTPWITADARQHVRFALPDGKEVATLDLPWNGKSPPKKEVRHMAYAIIQNHAVYAIINEYTRPAAEGKKARPYFVLEVEAAMWLAMAQRGEGGVTSYAIYDEVPPGINTPEGVAVADFPEPIGMVRRGTTEGDPPYDYTVDLALGRVTHSALIVLALLFLIDRVERSSKLFLFAAIVCKAITP
jgi:hypothetical protein